MKAFDEGNIRSTADDLLTAENTDWFRLGFNSQPFVDDQEGNYFPIDSWEDALIECENFCDDNDPLLVIPSIPGSGKSTFLKQFIAKQDAPDQMHYLRARSIFSLRHLLNAVSENFPAFRNLSTNTENFINDLRAVAREAGPQLLIVDDAQRLSKESLAGLLQIIAGQDLSNLWLRVILCGEPQLEDRVQNLFDEMEFSFTFNAIVLDSLDLSETRAYLKHRLDEAGYSEKFPFNKAMVKHIHTLSSGFPGRINRVAQQVMLDLAKNNQFARSTTAKKTSVLSKHKIKMLSLSLLGVSALTLWYLQQSNAPRVLHQQTYTTPVAHKFIDQQPLAQPVKPTLQFPYLKKADKTRATANKPVDISLSEQRMLRNKRAPYQAPKQPIKLSVHEANKTALPTPTVAASMPAPVVQPAHVALTPSASAPASAATTAATQTPSSTPAAQVNTNTPTEVVSTPISATTPKPAEQKPVGNTAADGFTLQLLGVHDKAKLIEFKKQQHLGDKAAYFETALHGTAWYVLTYGQFKTADEAHAAIKSLPLTVQAQKPWVKSLSAIHSPLIR